MARITPKGTPVGGAVKPSFSEFVLRLADEAEKELAERDAIAALSKPDSVPALSPQARRLARLASTTISAPAVDGHPPVYPVYDSVRGAIHFPGRTPITLGDTEEKVLKWLVNLKTATLSELRDKSGCESPNKVIGRLLIKHDWLRPYLTMPVKKGMGGYATLIQVKPAE